MIFPNIASAIYNSHPYLFNVQTIRDGSESLIPLETTVSAKLVYDIIQELLLTFIINIHIQFYFMALDMISKYTEMIDRMSLFDVKFAP